MSRILVVDDEPAIRRGIARVLERHGFDVETAADGRLGADWPGHHPCDVVVCDITMPRLDGLGCHLLQGFRFGKPGRPFPDVSW